LASVGLALILLSVIPFFFAYTAYPKKKPTMPTVTTIPLSLVTNASSVETFVIAPPNCGPLGGFLPLNTINYSVQGSSITTQTPLNISVTLTINYLSRLLYFIDTQGVVIDNSVLLFHRIFPTKEYVPYIPLPNLSFTLVKNDSNGLVYSTGIERYAGQLVTTATTIKLLEAGQLKGTVFMIIASKFGPNSCVGGVINLQVRNTTAIYVQSFHDLQLEKQTNFLENANLQDNAQIQYAEAQTQYSNSVVTTLTLVIVGFMMVDIGVSVYDVSEKKNQCKKAAARHGEGQADNKETPTD
jgi:hypothetical protein